MKVLLDTNVILDVLQARRPHEQSSTAVWAAVETGAAVGLLAAHSLTTIHYLIRKEAGVAKANQALASILKVFQVAAVDGRVLQEALALRWPDFEDAVTAAAARIAGCNLIVTRDTEGFRGSVIRCLPPEAAAPLLVE
jgi:predicted nucleic acid-binding protein